VVLLRIIFVVADVYSFCFDNGLSRYSSKIVYFYLLSYKAEQWHSFAEEIQDYQGGIQNFSASGFMLPEYYHGGKRQDNFWLLLLLDE